MLTIDIIFIGILVLGAIVGMSIGLGKSLSVFTGGIFGILICLAAAIMVGGAFNSMDFVNQFIISVDAWLIAKWDFLKYLKLGTVCYYVIIFVIMQIIRLVIVKLLKQVDEVENGIVKVINKALGATFVAAFLLALGLVILAGMKAFSNIEFIDGLIQKLGDGFLKKLYDNNPISFTGL